jgi:hypothetical protein
MTTGWIVKAGEMSFVKAQINDDTTERTYATFDDGSARRPGSTTQPTWSPAGCWACRPPPSRRCNGERVDQFTNDERTAAITADLHRSTRGHTAMQPLFRARHR